jgi:hypothetical protein
MSRVNIILTPEAEDRLRELTREVYLSIYPEWEV